MGTTGRFYPLSRQDLAIHAGNFRRRMAGHVRSPLDIERVIEFGLDLRLVPKRGLERSEDTIAALYLHGPEVEVWVDCWWFENRPRNVRWELAKVVAHHQLHFTPTGRGETGGRRHAPILYPECFTALQWSHLEREASGWASHLLVPAAELDAVFHRWNRSHHFDPSNADDQERLVHQVGHYFGIPFSCAEAILEVELGGG